MNINLLSTVKGKVIVTGKPTKAIMVEGIKPMTTKKQKIELRILAATLIYSIYIFMSKIRKYNNV